MGLFSKHKPDIAPRTVNGKPLLCLVCQHDQFKEREALLNTSVATFFDLDWANRKAKCIICAECGFIHWFLI